MERSPRSYNKADRKMIERNRRNQMKTLFSNLHSLVQQQSSTPSTSNNAMVPVPDQLEYATRYIKKLQIRVERLKEKKESLTRHRELDAKDENSMLCFVSPKIEIRRTGSALEVVLITGLDSQLMFRETLRVLEEEGAKILNATYSNAGDAIFHTIHCEVGDWEFTTSAGDRISERLRNVVSLQI